MALLLRSVAAGAACTPASCDAEFDCGSRECVGVTCETFVDAAGTECRPAAGVCDRAEFCDGHSLACPSDAKLSGIECRAALDACDAAELCDGSSADCPADVEIEPAISRVMILDIGVSPGYRHFDVELRGENLCEATVDGAGPGGFGYSLDLSAPARPASRLVTSVQYVEGLGHVKRGTYSFDVNRGLVAGTLEFVAGPLDPDGSIEILSPGDGATVGSDPTFSILRGCSNCGVARAAIFDQFQNELLAETPDNFALPPFGTPTELGLADFIGATAPLAEGDYVFVVEGIDGALLANQSFDGDTSGIHFASLVGTGTLNEIDFSIPEAAALPSALSALAALAACAAARGARCFRPPRPGLSLTVTTRAAISQPENAQDSENGCDGGRRPITSRKSL